MYKVFRNQEGWARFQQYYQLLVALATRDIKARYRRSSLGHFWAILQPLMMMSVWVLIRSFMGGSKGALPYVVFVYSGIIMWSFFSNIILQAAPSIQGNSGIIKKIKVPREIFLMVPVVTAAFDLIFSLLILSGLLVFYEIPFSLYMFWIPILFVITAFLAVCVGMCIAAVGIFKNDIILATGFLLQMWMFLSPIVYPLESIPEKWRSIYSYANPFVGIVESFHNVLLHQKSPDFSLLGASLFVTAVFFSVALPFFRTRAQYFADVM